MDSLLLAPMFGSFNKGVYIFTIPVNYYALCIVTGMIIAAVLSALLMKRRNMSSDFIYLLFIVCIPSAIIGARLYWCITHSEPIQNWYKITEGGLSILGGVFAGVFAGFLVCKIKKVPFTRAADCVVVNILLAQAIGRWGNFFNAEVYGWQVNNPSLQWFPFAVPIYGNMSGVEALQYANAGGNVTWHYALFFYEMLINLVGWTLLFTYAWYKKKKPNGILTCLYFVWYGVVRAVMEPFRDTDFILGMESGGNKMHSEMTAIIMALAGIAVILLLLIYNFLKEGSFTGSKKGDACGITNYVTPYKNDEPYFSKINMFGANYPPKPPKEKKGKNDPNTKEKDS